MADQDRGRVPALGREPPQLRCHGAEQLLRLAAAGLEKLAHERRCVRRCEIRNPDKLHPYGLRLHLVEADRVSTPDKCGGLLDGLGYTEGKNPSNGNKIYDGVEVDSSGAIVAYWVRNTYPHEWKNDTTTWQRVEVAGDKTGLPQILHIMESERPDQYRGVPLIAPIIEPLLQLRRYTESELIAALVQSYFTAWIVSQTPKSAIPFNEVGGGDLGGVPVDNPQTDNASHSENEYEMSPGQVFHLDKDEDIKFGSPNVPTAGFDTFVKTLCKLMGGAIEMPYELLLKEFNASYSASRAALLEAWEAFKMRRTWLVDSFCQPAYEIWLAEAVARGRVIAPGFLMTRCSAQRGAVPAGLALFRVVLTRRKRSRQQFSRLTTVSAPMSRSPARWAAETGKKTLNSWLVKTSC